MKSAQVRLWLFWTGHVVGLALAIYCAWQKQWKEMIALLAGLGLLRFDPPAKGAELGAVPIGLLLCVLLSSACRAPLDLVCAQAGAPTHVTTLQFDVQPPGAIVCPAGKVCLSASSATNLLYTTGLYSLNWGDNPNVATATGILPAANGGSGGANLTTAITSSLAAVSAPVSFNSQRITNVATPSSGTDAANKSYVDSTASASVPLILATHQTLSSTSHVGAPGTTASPSVWTGLPVGPARTVSSISLNLDAGETGVTFTVTAMYSTNYGQAWGPIPGAQVTVDAGAALGGKASFTPVLLLADSLVMGQLSYTGSPSAHDFVVGLY